MLRSGVRKERLKSGHLNKTKEVFNLKQMYQMEFFCLKMLPRTVEAWILSLHSQLEFYLLKEMRLKVCRKFYRWQVEVVEEIYMLRLIVKYFSIVNLMLKI